MAPVLVDTTVVIDVLRGREGATSRLRELRERGDTPFVCAITIEEVARGLRASERSAASKLFEGLGLVTLGKREGRQAGEWRGELARSGATLSQADCLVAAAALTAGGRLATGNPKDFPMAELRVEHWAVGA